MARPHQVRSLVQRQASDFTSESNDGETLVSGGPEVSYLADDIVAGRITDSGTLVGRLREFSRDELNELLAQIDYKASQRLASDPVVDGLIEAAKEEVQGALAGRVVLKPLPPCTQSYAPPSPAAFAADYDLERVRAEDLVLRPGSSSEAIQLVQQALHAFGCAVINKDLLPKFGPDGSYGNETARAVREFQSARGLGVDGTVGPKTLAALDAFVGVTSGEPTGFPCVKPDPTCPTGVSDDYINLVISGCGGYHGEGFAELPYVALEGQCTVGYGHVVTGTTCEPDPSLPRILGRPRCVCGPPFDVPISEGRARSMLRSDTFFRGGQWVRSHLPVDMTQATYDALADLTMHVGSLPESLLTAAKRQLCTDPSAFWDQYEQTALTIKGHPGRQQSFADRRRCMAARARGE